MSGSGRKLNALEQKIHQAALAAKDQTVSMADLSSLEDDTTMRTAALNFLLSAGLLKPMKSSSGKLMFRGVGKKEVDVKKDLSAEENLVLNHIQASGNEGIWTKHIKNKTDLHQTVVDRCLKSLVQKKLIKAVSGSVQHPTRKMYMLFHLEPSVEVTGGPWYTDKELDVEFIKLLSKACLKFIRDRSFPRHPNGSDFATAVPSDRLLYSISNSPTYPSATQVQTFLNKSRITETQLTVEHVEMLLNVLCVDGDIEKIPAMGAALWDSAAMEENNSGSDDEASSSRKKGKSSSKKRKRKTATSSEDDSDSEADTKKRKKHKVKRRRKGDDAERSASDSEAEGKKRRKKKKREAARSGSESDEDDEHEKKRSRSSSKSKKRRDDSSNEDSYSTGSDSPAPRKRSRSSSRQASSSKLNLDVDFGSTHVYRAVHPERLAFSFGWSQSPCLRCPTFDFCTPQGPVNPKECVYYGDWLSRKEVEEVS